MSGGPQLSDRLIAELVQCGQVAGVKDSVNDVNVFASLRAFGVPPLRRTGPVSRARVGGATVAEPLLLQPGPTLIDPRVVEAVGRPPVHHLSGSFSDVLDVTCDRLATIFDTRGEVVLLPATGRGGVEAAIASVYEPDRAVLVVSNGSFGEMIARIARALGARVITLEAPPGEPVHQADVEACLRRERVGIVALVHCETATGILNDLDGLGELVHRHGALLVVDAVSSVAGSPLPVDELGIDLAVGASQKAVGSLGGTSFVAVSGRAREAMLARSDQPRTSYLDLDRWWDQWLPIDRGGRLASGFRRQPWSTPTHPVFALEEACRIIVDEEGLDRRLARHAAAGAAVRAVLRSFGFRLFGGEETPSPTVTAFEGTDRVPAPDLIGLLRDEHGILVAGGLDAQRGQLVRIGHMAESARPGPLLTVLSAIAWIVHRRGGPGVGTDTLDELFFDAWTALAPVHG